ncbi:MAG TPA: hypothetical protein DER09_08440 [Prolixibacteraceae bacterium]|nr:hypothetical protein [Prolixibacteraceae bacterium]
MSLLFFSSDNQNIKIIIPDFYQKTRWVKMKNIFSALQGQVINNTNCYSKYATRHLEFKLIHADRPINRQIERIENMHHFVG